MPAGFGLTIIITCFVTVLVHVSPSFTSVRIPKLFLSCAGLLHPSHQGSFGVQLVAPISLSFPDDLYVGMGRRYRGVGDAAGPR